MTAATPPADPSPELVRRARDGESEALDALARWCYPRVARWALVRTGDPDEADDVTQEVVVGLQRSLRQFEGRSRFGTWLYRVAANVAGSRGRRRLRRLAMLARWPRPAPAPDEEARRLGGLHDAAVGDLVRVLLRDLPERQRIVFDLVNLQGFESGEVAAMLALEPATVRAHLMRARRAIRARIVERMPTLAEDRP